MRVAGERCGAELMVFGRVGLSRSGVRRRGRRDRSLWQVEGEVGRCAWRVRRGGASSVAGGEGGHREVAAAGLGHVERVHVGDA